MPLSVAPSNYFIDVWHSQVPELDVYSALDGKVPDGSRSQSPDAAPPGSRRR